MNISSMREMAFKCMYTLEIQKESTEELAEHIQLFIEGEEISSKNTRRYIRKLVNGAVEKEEEIVNLISRNLKKDWEISRISKINLALLKLAIYEIKYKEIEYKIVIDEVVKLAKKYGDENSANFINGVLASVVKEQTEKNEV